MTYVVSITSQGQMSIPSQLRKEFGLNGGRKAMVKSEDGKIVVEPVPDFLSLKGSIRLDKPVDLKKARGEFGKYLATRHLRKSEISK